MARDGTDTKERIERTALSLFVAQGVAETSVKEIAQAARVSQGGIYVHYPSKEQLAWELFSINFNRIGSELRRLAHDQHTLEEKLRVMIRYVFELFDEDWELVSFVFLVRHQHLRKMTHNASNPYVVFRGVIADALRGKDLTRQEVEVFASLVVGSIIQVIDTRILGLIKGKIAPLTEQVTQACVCLVQA